MYPTMEPLVGSVEISQCHPTPRPLVHPIQILHPLQPYQTNVFVALVGENGDTNQEQQKGSQTILPSLMKLLLLLLISQVLQLIAPTKVSLVQFLHWRKTHVSTPLCACLHRSLVGRYTQLSSRQLNA